MKAIAIAATAALLLAAPASAQDLIGAFYGHTMKVMDANGGHHYFRYNADFTFSESTNGDARRGYWRIMGSVICLSYVPYANNPEPPCVPISANQFADTQPEPQVKPGPLLIHVGQ